jgi:predicted transcriptional regulator
MFRDRGDEAGALLDLLGNVTRRRILEILANEPKYFIQLSRELGVSQQAVLKHLMLLEEFGLVTSFRAKSDLAAPDRKYYRLSRSLSLSVGISGDAVDIDMQTLGVGGKDEFTSAPRTTQFRELLSELKAVEKAKEIATVIKKTDSLVRDLDERTRELDEEKFAMLRMKQPSDSILNDWIS